jgi:hypothetical protein
MSFGAPVRLAASAAAVLLAVTAALPLRSTASETPHGKWTAVEFAFKPNSSAEPFWTVHLDAAGSGSYAEASETTPGPQPLTVGQSTLERLRRGEHAVEKNRCESRQKNIANTGEKTIRYQAQGNTITCTFNYSDDAALMDAAAAFEAIAETMQAGERLQHDERYDRLGLDAEIDTLVASARRGAAIELNNIAPVLQSLVADEHVIDRVRRKAARLLQDPGSITSAADADSSER